MATFICAVSTDDREPVAYALVEQAEPTETTRASYVVRDLGRFGENDPADHLKSLLASEPQMVAHSVVVTTGGQPTADRFQKSGLSAVPVETGGGPSRDGDTISVVEQTLVDTFAAVNRRSSMEVPGTLDSGSEAISALYAAMSDDAGAENASEETEALAARQGGDADAEAPPEDGPSPDIVEQTGSASRLSTARIGGDQPRRGDADSLVTGEVMSERQGLVDDHSRSIEAVELGEHRDVSLALALAVWYGEYVADELPTTDQADEIPRTRRVRAARQEAARRADGQR